MKRIVFAILLLLPILSFGQASQINNPVHYGVDIASNATCIANCDGTNTSFFLITNEGVEPFLIRIASVPVSTNVIHGAVTNTLWVGHMLHYGGEWLIDSRSLGAKIYARTTNNVYGWATITRGK